MKPTITVTLSLPWGPEYRASRQISEDIVRRTYAPVDHPSDDADPIIAMIFCTNPTHLRAVTRMRADIAEVLGMEIAAEIVKQMGGRDTIMGDPPEIRATPSMRESKETR